MIRIIANSVFGFPENPSRDRSPAPAKSLSRIAWGCYSEYSSAAFTESVYIDGTAEYTAREGYPTARITCQVRGEPASLSVYTEG